MMAPGPNGAPATSPSPSAETRDENGRAYALAVSRREGDAAISVLTRLGARALGHMPAMARLYAHMAGDPLFMLGPAPLKQETVLFRLPSHPLLLVNQPEQAARLMAPGATRPSPVLTDLLRPLTGAWTGETRLPAPADDERLFPRLKAETARNFHACLRQWLARGDNPVRLGQDSYALVLESLASALLDAPLPPDVGRRFSALQARAMQQAQILPLLLVPNDADARAGMIRRLGLERTAAELRALVQAHVSPLPGLPAEQACDQMIALLVLTTEAAASTFGWLAYELARDQLLQEGAALALGGAPMLGGEADRRFEGHPAEAVIQALIHETLRLHPPYGIFLRDRPAGSIPALADVPEQAHIAISPRILHRHRSFWTKPDMFAPERWLEGGDEEHKEGQAPAVTRAAFMPFGPSAHPYPLTAPAGERITLELVGQLVCELLSSTRLLLEGGQEPRALAHLSCRPEPDIIVKVLPRPGLAAPL